MIALFQALNLILVTSTELGKLRELLKRSSVNAAGRDLFVSLYSSWCHSPMATISLCLLAQVVFFFFFWVMAMHASVLNLFLFFFNHILSFLVFDRHINMLALLFIH